MPPDHPRPADLRLARVLASRRKRVAENPAALAELRELLAAIATELSAAPDLDAARSTLARHQLAFQILALQLGFDPRPSALAGWLRWGAEATLREQQPDRWAHAIARVNPSSQIQLCRDAEAAGLGDWRRLEATDRSLADLTIEKVAAFSTDKGTTWEVPRAPGHTRNPDAELVHCRPEVELRTLILMKRFAPGTAAPDDDPDSYVPPTKAEIDQLQVQAVHEIGKGVARHFVQWPNGAPSTTPYLLQLVVTPGREEVQEAPLGAWLPDVLDLPYDPERPGDTERLGAAELASILPDALVVELTGKNINWLKEGFTAARGRSGDNLVRHTAQEPLATALTRKTTQMREVLVLGDLVRQDVDWIWREVERRRRLRGTPTAKRSAGVQSEPQQLATLLNRREAREYWFDLAGGDGCRLDETARVNVCVESAAEYPWFVRCRKCRTWWLHGCELCRANLQNATCARRRQRTRCPNAGCSGQLTSTENDDRGATPKFIAAEIRKYIDAQRKSGQRFPNS